MSDANSESWIGRAGAARRDPLDVYRWTFDWNQIRRLDALATFHGVTHVDKSVDELQRERETLEASLERPLDHHAAADARYRRGEPDAAEVNTKLAEERLRLAEGRMLRGPDPAAEKSFAKATADVKAAERASIAAYDAYENSYSLDEDGDIDRDAFQASLDEAYYDRRWLRANEGTLAKIISVDRELEIRDEQRALDRGGWQESDVSRSDTPIKEVGTEESVLLAERSLRETGANRELGRSEVPSVSRDDVPHPVLLDSSWDALGERRRQTLEEQLHPVADWVGQQPDEWVEKRFAELRDERPEFDRKAARHAARLENRLARMTGERDLARDNAALYATGDPQRAAVEERTAMSVQGKLDGIEAELTEMREQGIHPDVALERMEDNRRLFAVYDREKEVRRQLDIAAGAYRASESPSERVVDVLGAEPAGGSAEYRRLAHAIEARHLDPHSPRVEPQLDQGPTNGMSLDEQIDDYRAEAGMALLTPENTPALEHGDRGF